MTDEDWPIWRWHSYPYRDGVSNQAEQLKEACEAMAFEILEHNPMVRVTTAKAFARVATVAAWLGAELRASRDEDYAQRWLYKKLIEEGRCP